MEVLGAVFADGLAYAEVDSFSIYYVGTGEPEAYPPPRAPPPPPPAKCPEVKTYENELYGVSAAAGVLLIALVALATCACVQRARVIAMAPEEEDEDDLLALPPPEADPASLQGPYDGAIAILEFQGARGAGAISSKDVTLAQGKELV